MYKEAANFNRTCNCELSRAKSELLSFDMKWVFEIKSTLTNAFANRENVQDAKVRKDEFRSYYITYLFQNTFILISLRKNSQEGKQPFVMLLDMITEAKLLMFIL